MSARLDAKTDGQRSPRIALSPAYLRAIERVEQMPSNRSGADKSWVAVALEVATQHHRRAIRR